MSPQAAMIFAAGLGTRMGALTRDRPKPLIEVAGRALIDHALALTDGLNLRVTLNLHYHAEMLRTHLAGRDLLFANESARLLDTGGGLKSALPLLRADPVFTLNSDAVWTGNPLQTLAQGWASQMDALLLLVPSDHATGHSGSGDFDIGPDGRISRGGPFVYSGAQILRTGPVAAVKEDVFSLNHVWNDMITRGTVFGVVHDGGWCDVGRPENIVLAEAMLSGNQ